MYVCICHAVTDCHIDAAIADGAASEDDVSAVTGAGTGCGGCLTRICERLAQADAGRLGYAAAIPA